MLLTVPSAVALAVIATPIVRVLFERGAFSPADTLATASALAIFALGLPAFVLIKVFSPAYFAREDTRTPMRFAAHQPDRQHGRLGRRCSSCSATSGWMPHLGIAVATTLGGWLNALLLWRGLAARGHFALDARMPAQPAAHRAGEPRDGRRAGHPGRPAGALARRRQSPLHRAQSGAGGAGRGRRRSSTSRSPSGSACSTAHMLEGRDLAGLTTIGLDTARATAASVIAPSCQREHGYRLSDGRRRSCRHEADARAMPWQTILEDTGLGRGRHARPPRSRRSAPRSASAQRNGVDRAAFTAAVVALSAKLSKSPTASSLRIEEETFERLFQFEPDEADNVRWLFRLAAKDTAGFESLCARARPRARRPARPEARRVRSAAAHRLAPTAFCTRARTATSTAVADIFGYDRTSSAPCAPASCATPPIPTTCSASAARLDRRRARRRTTATSSARNHPDVLAGKGPVARAAGHRRAQARRHQRRLGRDRQGARACDRSHADSRSSTRLHPSPNFDERRRGLRTASADPALHRPADGRALDRGAGRSARQGLLPLCRRRGRPHHADGGRGRCAPGRRASRTGPARPTSTRPRSASRSRTPATPAAIPHFPRAQMIAVRDLCLDIFTPARDPAARRARAFRRRAGPQDRSGREIRLGRGWREPASATGSRRRRRGDDGGQARARRRRRGRRAMQRRLAAYGYGIAHERRLRHRDAVRGDRVPAPFPPGPRRWLLGCLERRHARTADGSAAADTVDTAVTTGRYSARITKQSIWRRRNSRHVEAAVRDVEARRSARGRSVARPWRPATAGDARDCSSIAGRCRARPQARDRPPPRSRRRRSGSRSRPDSPHAAAAGPRTAYGRASASRGCAAATRARAARRLRLHAAVACAAAARGYCGVRTAVCSAGQRLPACCWNGRRRRAARRSRHAGWCRVVAPTSMPRGANAKRAAGRPRRIADAAAAGAARGTGAGTAAAASGVSTRQDVDRGRRPRHAVRHDGRGRGACAAMQAPARAACRWRGPARLQHRRAAVEPAWRPPPAPAPSGGSCRARPASGRATAAVASRRRDGAAVRPPKIDADHVPAAAPHRRHQIETGRAGVAGLDAVGALEAVQQVVVVAIGRAVVGEAAHRKQRDSAWGSRPAGAAPGGPCRAPSSPARDRAGPRHCGTSCGSCRTAAPCRSSCRAKRASVPPKCSAIATATSLADLVISAFIASIRAMVSPGSRSSLVGGGGGGLVDDLDPGCVGGAALLDRLERQIERHDLGQRGGIARLVGLVGMQHRAVVGIDDHRGMAVLSLRRQPRRAEQHQAAASEQAACAPTHRTSPTGVKHQLSKTVPAPSARPL